MHRSGDLTAVWVPDEVHEAMREAKSEYEKQQA
jgi:hypothetical protein